MGKRRFDSEDAAQGGTARAGVVWSSASFAASRIVNFGTTAVLARLLVPREFGVVAAILIFITFAELISDVGMKAAVVYEQEQGGSARLDVAFTVNLLLACVLALLALVLAPATAAFFNLSEHVGLFRLAALNPLLIGLGNMHDAVLVRRLAFRRRMIPEVARSVVKAVTQVVLAVAGLGAAALIIGLLIGSVAWSASLWSLTGYSPRLRLERRPARELLRYGLPASAHQGLAVVIGRIDVMVIGRLLGERAIGLYSVAFRVPELIIEGMAWTVSQVAFPALSRKRVRNEAGVAEMTARIMRSQALYAFPVAAALAVLSPSVILVLFGSEWREAAGVLSGIAVATAIGALSFPLGDVFKAMARQRTLLIINLVSLPLMVGALVVASEGGIVAIAWTRVGTRLLFGAVMMVTAARSMNTHPRPLLMALGPGLGAALGVACGASVVRLSWPEEGLLPLLAGAAAAGVGGALALRLLSPATFRELSRPVVSRGKREGRA